MYCRWRRPPRQPRSSMRQLRGGRENATDVRPRPSVKTRASIWRARDRGLRGRRAAAGGIRPAGDEIPRAAPHASSRPCAQHHELDPLVVKNRLPASEAEVFETIHDPGRIRRVALPLACQRPHRSAAPRIEAEQRPRVIGAQPPARQALGSDRRRANQQIEHRLPHASRERRGGRIRHHSSISDLVRSANQPA
jgi:hypothetical protein